VGSTSTAASGCRPHNREDMERLAQYIIRNPFSVYKMQPTSFGHSIIYSSGTNPKILRNFEIAYRKQIAQIEKTIWDSCVVH
jgi:hypothetical protein